MASKRYVCRNNKCVRYMQATLSKICECGSKKKRTKK